MATKSSVTKTPAKNSMPKSQEIVFPRFYAPRSLLRRDIGSIRDDPYWTSTNNSLELIELSSISKASLVQVSSCSNIGSIRDDSYWTSTNNSLELIELSSINKVSLV